MREYAPHEVRLANEIADTLQDRGSLQLFLHFAGKYKEEQLRALLEKVMSIPERKIKKTRGALFTYLVSQYENDNSRG
ncbi:MAG TPA: hypothetical protein DCQ50_21155 [Chryseobacterium sp.]|nr:hypothetical protein [Chryseobacterium sp.]